MTEEESFAVTPCMKPQNTCKLIFKVLACSVKIFLSQIMECLLIGNWLFLNLVNLFSPVSMTQGISILNTDCNGRCTKCEKATVSKMDNLLFGDRAFNMSNYE